MRVSSSGRDTRRPTRLAPTMESMAAILLVDDDPSVREALTMALEREGHRVDTAATGDDALARWRRSPPDLILLDLMLPGRDGVEVCQVIRREDQVPIIMLTARSDPIDVVVGLESGADDYVAKPFETRVLLAPSGRRFSVGDIKIDPAGMTVSKAGRQLHLTPTELRLLLELARRPGQVFTRTLLLETVWDYAYLGDSRLVDACVQRLRAKIEDDASSPVLLQTVRGVGYKLVAAPEVAGTAR